MPTVTISEGTAIAGTVYAGVSDLIVQSVSPTVHSSTSSTLEVSYWTPSDTKNTVLLFSGLSNISGPGTVSDAVLGMQVSSASSHTDLLTLHKLKLPVSMTQATWNERQTGVAWPNGGNDASTIEAAAASTTAASGAVGTFVTWSGAGLDALVQDWIDNPGANYGAFITRLDTTPNTRSSVFRSSNNGTLTARPYLTFTWTAGPPPTPPTVSISSPTVDRLASTMTFVATLSAAAGSSLSVDYATQDGTALAGVDYAATSGTLTFLAGETTKDIVVPLLTP